MEEQVKKTVDTKDKIQIAFLGIMLLCAFGLIFVGIKIVKYHDMLSNPLGYNLDKFGINSCTCINNEGQSFKVNSISKGDSSVIYKGSSPLNLNKEMINFSGG